MGIKKSNEVTVKIKTDIDRFYAILEEKGYTIIDRFTLDDIYFIPKDLKIDKMETRDILAEAVLIRNRIGEIEDKKLKTLTFKQKKISEDGSIINQRAINCEILNIEEAKEFLTAIGYKEIMRIIENSKVYEKDGFNIAVKNIIEGEKLIEIETDRSSKINTIEKIKQKLLEEELPICTDNYFVKKAEIELNRILRK